MRNIRKDLAAIAAPPDISEFTTFYNRLRPFDTFDFKEVIFSWHARNVNEVVDVLI
jgi:hypothetical protein